MIARKVRPGVLEILDIDLTNELQSRTLVEITDKDAYLLLLTTQGFKVGEGNKATISYNAGDATDAMFNAIAQKVPYKTETFDVSRTYTEAEANIPGTSVLLRDVEKKIIKVARRTSGGNIGAINRLYISNKARDKFFDVARKSRFYEETKTFGIDMKDANDYNVWSEWMNKRYLEITDALKNKNAVKKNEKRKDTK